MDRLFRVGRGDAPAAGGGRPLRRPHRCRPSTGRPDPDPAAGLSHPAARRPGPTPRQPARLFHVRDRSRADLARMARVLTGQSVGLVLSGGGARAYAHVGAIRALREAGVPIDFVGGVSMGAVIAAGVAMGWDDEEMDLRIRKAFVDTSPLDDIAFPLLAMTHGRKGQRAAARTLRRHPDRRPVAALLLPLVEPDHRRLSDAPARPAAARAAGLDLPAGHPAAGHRRRQCAGRRRGDEELPGRRHARMQLGPIVGVDVTRGRSITADEVARPASVWRWILSGQWRKGPPIVSLLMRAATVTAGRDLAAAARPPTCWWPEVDAIEIRDWKAYDPAKAAGHEAMVAALAALSRPVTDLRRRPSLDEQASAAVADFTRPAA